MIGLNVFGPITIRKGGFYNLDKIVAGDALSDVVDALMAEDQAARLAQMEMQG